MSEGNFLADLYQEDDILEDMVVDKKRETCNRCARPLNVCLCPFMVKEALNIDKNIKIWIFMHPDEIKKPLRTTLILEKCLDNENLEIIMSRKFTVEKFPQLKEVYENEHTYVLYPSKDAVNIDTLPSLIKEKESNDRKFHIIVIDGTWEQAYGMYNTNTDLQKLKQLKIDTVIASVFKIRTQPRETFLSTLETVALTLSKLENKQEIFDDLIRPLEALCKFQFEHGAVTHQSKEYLILNGLYNKPISRQNLRRYTENTRLQSNLTDVDSHYDE